MIFIISRGYPSKAEPLNGIFELDQAKALINIGYNIIFVVLDFRSIFRLRKFGFFEKEVGGIRCFHISFPLGNLENPIFNFIARKITWLGSGFLRNRFGKPDLLHSHFVQISSLAVEIKNRFKVPLVVTEHSSLLNTDVIEPNLFALAKKTYNNSDLVIAVSTSIGKKLTYHFNVYPTVVNNIVDNSVFNLVESGKQDSVQKKFVFISVGSLNFNKGFDILLKAFALSKFDNNVKLIIIGDGELKSELQIEAENLGLNSEVEFLGYQSREKIFEEFKNSNGFVLASRGETFGLVYIEALLSGLPVIATACGGPEEFINESNGILVPIEESAKLSEALSNMVKNSSMFDNSKISLDASNRFAPQVIAEKLSLLYDSVLDKTKNKYV
jgi:L-malate glycosyltransferase